MIDPSDDWFRSQRYRRKSSGMWNCLTLVVLACLVPLFLLTLIIFINPHSPINPFPPPMMPAIAELGQSTKAPDFFSTQGNNQPDVVLSTEPGNTPIIPNPVVTQPLMEVTSEPVIDFHYAVLNAPAAINGGLIVADHGNCQWMGVGGQVVGMDGKPIPAIKVQLGGVLNDTEVNLTSLSGTSLQYGPAGFEFTLSERPVESNKTLWVRLLSDIDEPLSDRVYFNTYDSCDRNLVVINFKQIK